MDNQPTIAEVAWEGDSLDVVKSFPKPIQADLGADIRRLQLGERPLSFRSMPTIAKGVFELKQRDDNGWYRLIYLSKIGNTLHMLHGFVKKSAKTSQNDIDIAKQRLKAVKARIVERKREETKHARREQ